MISIPNYCELTIRRANGDIETVNYTDATRKARQPIIQTIRPQDFARLQSAYKAAGQELMSYRNVTQDVEEAKPTEAELASDRAHADYVAHHNRVAGISAGGESYDHAR
ncbi:MAG: hypothetical protein ACYCY2_02260 [Acidithiobacillus ferriphilus]